MVAGLQTHPTVQFSAITFGQQLDRQQGANTGAAIPFGEALPLLEVFARVLTRRCVQATNART
jgi:hypothetical protein